MLSPFFKISSSGDGSVFAVDKTEYKKEDDNSVSMGNFRFSETATFCAITRRRINISEKTIDTFCSEHKCDEYSDSDINQSFRIPINEDGAYRIIYMIMPTIEWFRYNLDYNKDLIDSYIERDGGLFITDGIGIFMIGNVKYGIEESPKQAENDYELNVVNIDRVLLSVNANNMISCFATVNDFVSVANLISCYLSLCRSIFDCNTFTCCSKNASKMSETIFKRDMVWMALNTIEILAERCKNKDICPELDEIDSIISRISGCNGLCANINPLVRNTGGCGCGKL